MQEKLNLIDELLNKIEEKFDYSLATEIMNTFRNDIPGIKEAWDFYGDESKSKASFIGALKNYKATLKKEEETKNYEIEKLRLQQPQITATAELNSVINIDVTISNVVESINKLNNEILIEKDKEYLVDELYELEKLKNKKDKSRLWEKIKSIFQWCFDKSFDVFLVILPYLINICNECKQ